MDPLNQLKYPIHLNKMFFVSVTFYVLLFLVLMRIVSVLTRVRCCSKVCLVEKVALVTGGSSGIGYHIALKLASRGCKVIVADKVVDEDIKLSMERETKNPNIIFEYVDLASFKSVRKLAKKLNDSEDKLDILINNAGVPRGPNTPSEDGFNSTMQINYYSSFLLTHLLIGLMKKSSSAKIIFTSSVQAYLHRISRDNIGTMEIKKKMISSFNYMNSKFCLIVASDIFAKKLETYNITSNAFHPGVVRTPLVEKYFQSDIPWWEKLTKPLVHFVYLLIGKSPDDGAEIALHLATANEVEKMTAQFFIGLLPFPKPKAAMDHDLCAKIWRISEEIVKLNPTEKL